MSKHSYCRTCKGLLFHNLSMQCKVVRNLCNGGDMGQQWQFGRNQPDWGLLLLVLHWGRRCQRQRMENSYRLILEAIRNRPLPQWCAGLLATG